MFESLTTSSIMSSKMTREFECVVNVSCVEEEVEEEEGEKEETTITTTAVVTAITRTHRNHDNDNVNDTCQIAVVAART